MSKSKARFKLSLLLLLIPVVTGIGILIFVFSNTYRVGLGRLGADRLITTDWGVADKAFKVHQPTPGRKYAYYRLKEGQNVQNVAAHFSVNPQKLAALNPGTLAAGATVKITPLEAPFQPIKQTNGLLSQARIIEQNGIVRVKNDFKFPKVVTNMPELVHLLMPYGVFEQTGPKSYRMNKSVSIEENIRIDITGDTVDQLELTSAPHNALCLCFQNSEALIQNTSITSYEPNLKGPDTVQTDERSFVRAYASARMDVISSKVSYLGNGLDISTNPVQNEGGTYGISWRIPKGGLGIDLATGWVEGNTFYKNYYGSYSFGASGMVWRKNHYLENDIYGLDPHDDSNNALVEDNIFERNHKHGFIISKRCNYNVIRNNVSFGNKLHGFMIHQDSVYNVIENNVAYDNTDNYVIFASDYNTIRNNRSFNPRGSHIRINAGAVNTYITNNELYGGSRGIYVYGGARNIYVANNRIQQVGQVLATNGAQNVFLADNTIAGLYFKMANNDRIIFGPNQVADTIPALPSGVSEVEKPKS